jgi:hypothetical protein
MNIKLSKDEILDIVNEYFGTETATFDDDGYIVIDDVLEKLFNKNPGYRFKDIFSTPLPVPQPIKYISNPSPVPQPIKYISNNSSQPSIYLPTNYLKSRKNKGKK